MKSHINGVLTKRMILIQEYTTQGTTKTPRASSGTTGEFTCKFKECDCMKNKLLLRIVYLFV